MEFKIDINFIFQNEKYLVTKIEELEKDRFQILTNNSKISFIWFKDKKGVVLNKIVDFDLNINLYDKIKNLQIDDKININSNEFVLRKNFEGDAKDLGKYTSYCLVNYTDDKRKNSLSVTFYSKSEWINIHYLEIEYFCENDFKFI